MSRVTVIAEAGSMHEGDLDAMYQMIDVAAECGADVFKGQWVSSAIMLAARRQAMDYINAYQRIEYPASWHSLLRTHCEAAGLEYLCTVYLPQDIDVIASDVKRFKIASFEATDDKFLEAHLPFQKPMLISTGMSDQDRLHHLRAFRSSRPPGHVALLHCISAYPTPLDETWLHAIRNEWLDGYSDHTGETITGAIAVAAGAKIIEVHFRPLVANPANPDYGHSLGPSALRQYVNLIRQTERMLGDQHLDRQPQPSEQPMLRYRCRNAG